MGVRDWRFFDGYYEEDAIAPTDDFYIDPRRVVRLERPPNDEWWNDQEIVDAINRQTQDRQRN